MRVKWSLVPWFKRYRKLLGSLVQLKLYFKWFVNRRKNQKEQRAYSSYFCRVYWQIHTITSVSLKCRIWDVWGCVWPVARHLFHSQSTNWFYQYIHFSRCFFWKLKSIHPLLTRAAWRQCRGGLRGAAPVLWPRPPAPAAPSSPWGPGLPWGEGRGRLWLAETKLVK